MNRRPYAGTWTALITPFHQDGFLDEEALRNIVRDQVSGGVTGVLPIGTTGESPTIEHDEMRRIFEIVREEAGDSVRVLAGTGSNCTSHAVGNTRMAKELGADIALVVCPYYNKPTQEGLRRHFLAIAEVGLPIMVYNIKGRTAVNMTTDTL
ncbi:dihydrodipicolinate synthase family protein, partial [Patescibacteria group bacterium]|nr:dihydrodipicolinate synthase family protein [Patescibacteria group bacterium]